MGRFDEIARFEKLKKLEPTESARRMPSEYPGVPADYVEFLSQVGAGTIGECSFALYGALISPHEVYDAESAVGLQGIWLFGDDYAGYCVGFAPDQGWVVVEIDPIDKSVDVVAPTFEISAAPAPESIGAWPGCRHAARDCRIPRG